MEPLLHRPWSQEPLALECLIYREPRPDGGVQMGAREHLLSQCDRDSFPGLPPETFGFAQKC